VGHKRKEISNRQQLQIGRIELLQKSNVAFEKYRKWWKGEALFKRYAADLESVQAVG